MKQPLIERLGKEIASLESLLKPYAKLDRVVWGYASTDAVDKQGDVIAKEALEDALPEYKRWRNIREMHEKKPVGKAIYLKVTSRGLLVGARIYDDSTWERIQKGILKGFSIGGIVTSKRRDVLGGRSVSVITSMVIAEISVVDQPANPDTGFFHNGKENKLFRIFGKKAESAEAAEDCVMSEELLKDITDRLEALTSENETLVEVCRQLNDELAQLGGRLDAIEKTFSKTKAIKSDEEERPSKWDSIVRLLS